MECYHCEVSRYKNVNSSEVTTVFTDLHVVIICNLQITVPATKCSGCLHDTGMSFIPRSGLHMQGNCSILTLNVRGLRNQIKKKKLTYLIDQIANYIFYKKFIPSQMMKISVEASGVVTFSFRMDQLTHIKGVCNLINPSLSLSSIENFSKDRDGIIVSIDLTFKSVDFSLCNVYAPSMLRTIYNNNDSKCF